MADGTFIKYLLLVAQILKESLPTLKTELHHLEEVTATQKG